MNTHLALAAMLSFASLSAWTYLNLKLKGRWSLFRIYCLWNLALVAFVVPVAWVDFYRYSELAWPCRYATAALAILVLAVGFFNPSAPGAGWIAAGLLVDNLFPAISETSGVIQNGGWVRLVPVVSNWLCLILFIKGISGNTGTMKGAFLFKRRDSASFAGRARQTRT